MGPLDERISFLEGRVAEHSKAIDGIRDALVHLEQRMDARFEAVDRRLDALDTKFVWVVGMQVTTLAAVVAALIAR